MLKRIFILLLAVLGGGASFVPALGQPGPASCHGTLRDAAGNPLAEAVVELRRVGAARAGSEVAAEWTSKTDPHGAFNISGIPPGRFKILVRWQGRAATAETPLEFAAGETLEVRLEFFVSGERLLLHRETDIRRHQQAMSAPPGNPPSTSAAHAGAASPEKAVTGPQASGGERLSSREVSALPLNKRDFSQLLLLAAGTMTDTNGAANFTQQFAINGQRGTTAVFSIDGIDATDSELGGATFANFNVEAIEEIDSDSGAMAAEVGRGAAGYTNVITKSGTADVHGAVFEFFRNAALDARNFFDRRTPANPGRIPPFIRNEFGFTNGGPVVLPGIYNGRKRTFYFGQYQGFRQVLGTTQVLAVPSLDERAGLDTTAFPGDTLFVPVDPRIAPVLAAYPLPNDPQGPYGPRTYATSSKVTTNSDQFSIRIDHTISEKSRLFARFNYNNLDGPLTNPSQTAIDPSFAVRFLDRQRNFGLSYTRTPSPNLTWQSSLGLLRTTPLFPTINRTQPGLVFGDNSFEPFNIASGAVIGAYGNVIQARQDVTYVHGAHTFKFGAEARLNRDTTVFAFTPNGMYQFGGGTAYAQVAIPSASGLHDIQVGDPLPNALTGFLTATPYVFSTSLAPPLFAQGDHIGESAIRRESYNFYFQDSWKVTPRFQVNYGIRYEVNGRIHEAKHRTSNPYIVDAEGRRARFWEAGARARFLYYPRPPYDMDWNGWGPRLSLEWRATDRTTLRAAGAITTILPNLFQTDMITGSVPFVVNPYFTASPSVPLAFQDSVRQFDLPDFYTPEGFPVFPTGRSTDVPANTEIDLQRFEDDLAALPGGQPQALLLFGMARDIRNGYIATYTAGFEREIGDLDFNLSYVATAGVKIPSLGFPNSYGGAEPAFAPFTRFDASGNVLGGIGPEFIIHTRSHSTYHSLQASVEKSSARAGLGFQFSYTLGKAIDDTSNILGGFSSGQSGVVLQSFPQNPWNPGAEKGPATFDLRHVGVLSLVQVLPLERLGFLRPLGKRLTSGWQFLNITTLTSASPFTVFSGIQQTGVGSIGADRPDRIGQPVLSTSRKVREDYFGAGAANPDYFNIPIGVPGGTGPNQGRFGTLGRNTFRGPAYRNVDIALIKDTPFGRRGNSEALTLQLRAEVFNVFNLVNFGLPANVLRGTGFGFISRTAGPSRQIQFSLKLIY